MELYELHENRWQDKFKFSIGVISLLFCMPGYTYYLFYNETEFDDFFNQYEFIIYFIVCFYFLCVVIFMYVGINRLNDKRPLCVFYEDKITFPKHSKEVQKEDIKTYKLEKHLIRLYAKDEQVTGQFMSDHQKGIIQNFMPFMGLSGTEQRKLNAFRFDFIDFKNDKKEFINFIRQWMSQ